MSVARWYNAPYDQSRVEMEMRRTVRLEYDVSEFRGSFTVDLDEFSDDMSENEIAERIRELVDETARVNVSFYPENLPATVREIQEALALQKQEDENE